MFFKVKSVFQFIFYLSALIFSHTVFSASDEDIKQLKKENEYLNQRVSQLNQKLDRLDSSDGRSQRENGARFKTKDGKAYDVTTLDEKAYHHRPITPLPAPVIDNYALYIKKSFPNFYQIVTANSPKSYANRDLCIQGMFCVSGLANFDLVYTDRFGSFVTQGSAIGVGVRPLFYEKDNNITGSINNIDLFIDAAINNWVSTHIDLAYVNASRRTALFSKNDEDWTNVYRAAAALKVNEAYLLFADPAIIPLFVQLGRIYAPFGDYYPFPMTPSLTQLLSQMRTGGFVVGAIFPSGFYIEGSWNMAELSSERLSVIPYVLEEFGRISGFDHKQRNYGGKAGYRGFLFDPNLFVNVNGSVIADIRDADYLAAAFNLYNLDIKQIPLTHELFANTFIIMERTPAAALHADFKYKCFGASADYVGVFRQVNSLVNNSKIWAYSTELSFFFSVHDRPSILSLGYQGSGNANIFRRVDGLAPPQFPVLVGNILPEHRYQLTYKVQVLPWVNVGAQWVHDKDYKMNQGGTGRGSNQVMFRVNAEL